MRNKLRKLDFLNYSNDRTLVRETRGEYSGREAMNFSIINMIGL